MLFSRRPRSDRRSNSSSNLKSADPIKRACLETLESRRLLTAAVWTGAGSNTLFSDANNWSGNAVPTAGQDVTFPSGVTNKTVTVDSNVTVGTVEFDDTYTVAADLGNNSLTVNGITSTAGNSVINSPVVLGQTATVLIYQVATLQINSNISDGGSDFGISIQGNGPLTLTGSGDTYTGTTQVQGGVLDLDTSLTSVVDVFPTSSFNGTGSVTTLEGNDATFSAAVGSAAGSVAISNSLSLDNNSDNMVAVDLGGTNASSVFTVNGGTISLGNATLTGTVVGGYTPAAGDVITIIKNNTGNAVIGTFDNLPQGAAVSIGGENYTVSYTGGTGHDVTLTAGEADSTISITSSHVPVTQGQHVTFTANVAGVGGNSAVPTGTVTFLDNGDQIGTAQMLSNGTVSFNDTTLPVGTNTITATYGGDNAFSGSTTISALTVNVRPAATTPTITSATATASTHGFTIGATVVGADTSTAGAAGLTYTWTAVHVPAGAKQPTFNVNGTNAASSIIARFSKDGGYTLQCTVKNAGGNSVTTDVLVTVSQKATALRLEPHDAQIAKGGTEQYTGTVLDQFSHAMRTPQTLTYVVSAGSGSISSSGLYTASSVAGNVLIELEADGLTGTVGASVS